MSTEARASGRSRRRFICDRRAMGAGRKDVIALYKTVSIMEHHRVRCCACASLRPCVPPSPPTRLKGGAHRLIDIDRRPPAACLAYSRRDSCTAVTGSTCCRQRSGRYRPRFPPRTTRRGARRRNLFEVTFRHLPSYNNLPVRKILIAIETSLLL